MSITPYNPADFSPTMDGYSGQGNFRFWCQVAMPLVYDDSLSYYELLCKMVTYLNNTINDVRATENNVDKLKTAYDLLQGYVNNYFASLDVQEEINIKLDTMASDGSLTNLLTPIVSEEVGDWLSTHLQPTSPPVDSSLTVANAAADSKVVGDIFYRDLPRNASIVSLPTLNVKAPVSYSSFSDFKTNVLYYVTANTLKTLLEPYQNQSDTSYHIPNYDMIPSSDSITYTIFKITPFRSIYNSYIIFIMSYTGSYMWCGHRANNATITYNENTYDGITFVGSIAPLDSTLTSENKAATAKKVGDSFAAVLSLIFRNNSSNNYHPVVPLLTNYGNISSLNDIPSGSYGMIGGSVLLNILPNDDTFPSLDKISPSKSYILYKIGLSTVNDWFIYYISSYGGDYIWRGYVHTTTSGWRLLTSPKDFIPEKILKYCYTKFGTDLVGAYAVDGTIVNNTTNTLSRSQMLRVNPNEKVYVGITLNTTAQTKVVAICACFDKYGNYITAIAPSDITAYAPINITDYDSSNPNFYPCPDGTDNSFFSLDDYETFASFVTPSNCYYIVIPTFTDKPSALYKYSVSNCSSFRKFDKENVVLLEGSRNKTTRNLCVIGPSTVMIDLLYRSANNHQYVLGFQEYIKPYYNNVRSFGYSGAAYYTGGDYTGTASIYDMIVNGTDDVPSPDLSSYDEFLILPSTNGVNGTNYETILGDYNSDNEATYFGGLNKIINKILTANPKAIIYLANLSPSYAPSTAMSIAIKNLNEKYRDLCASTCCILIDSCMELGMGHNNKENFTYDGVHFNQDGSALYGEFLIRNMI